MKKLATVAAIPLFAGFLFAQAQADQTTRTETTITKTTWNGTLVDAGCRTTHTENKQTTSDESKTTTKTETTHQTECPVTTTTTTFGLMTPEGQYVRFDEPSNTKIVEMVKTNKKWSKFISDREPLKVRVVGTPNGDVVVLETIR